MQNASLASLGWNDFFQHALEAQPPGTLPFRILAAHRGRWLVSDGLACFPAVPGGALLIDTPGLQELQLWGDEAVAPVFADVAAFAQRCRFRDCRHAGEPGCAVGQALADGILGEDRLASYRKLERERTFRRSQEDPQAFRERKAQERRFHRQLKQYNKDR